MKTFVYALVALALLLGLVVSPAAASSSAAAACGDTYVVQKGDYLTKIAKTCGVTLDQLIKANPEIKNPSLIYPGQVIRTKAGTTIPTPTPAPSSGEYVVVKGDTLYKISVKFGTTLQAILAANPEIKNASVIYVGQKIKLPVGSTSGGGATSGLITISASSAKVGAVIDVTVKGFPANTDVDFRLGKQGEGYSQVVDGKTDASGAATAKVTIPATAKVAEKWVVVVLTTNLAQGKSATSPVITIAQ